MIARSPRAFCPYEGRRMSLGDLAAGLRHTTTWPGGSGWPHAWSRSGSNATTNRGFEALEIKCAWGAPGLFPDVAVHLVKLACERPKLCGRSLSQWDCTELARALVQSGVTETISASTVRRILAPHKLKSWRHHRKRQRAFIAFLESLEAKIPPSITIIHVVCDHVSTHHGSEGSSLRWTALDIPQGTLRINNRTGQVDRVLYLSPDVATALQQGYGLQKTAADYVFPSRMRRQGALPLGARHLRTRLLRSLPLAGSTTRYGPPARRHTFATQRLNAGASLEVIKTLMGHRALPMTLRYP
jgi:hypothetical protein